MNLLDTLAWFFKRPTANNAIKNSANRAAERGFSVSKYVLASEVLSIDDVVATCTNCGKLAMLSNTEVIEKHGRMHNEEVFARLGADPL